MDTLLYDLNTRLRPEEQREFDFGFCELVKRVNSPIDSISKFSLKTLGAVSVIVVAFNSELGVRSPIDLAYDAIGEERNNWEQIKINLE